MAVLAVLLAPVALAGYRAVVPWERADCAGAAAFVRHQRLSADRVTAPNWEYQYYFRDMRGLFTPSEDFDNVTDGRLWLIITGNTPPEREIRALTHFRPEGWTKVQRYAFFRTAVYLLEKDQAGQARAVPAFPGRSG
jgi:hypothetical protein